MNVALRIFAGVIDLLQLIFFIVLVTFQFITPVGGGIAGGVSGAVLCWNLSTGFWDSVVNAATCLAGGGLVGAGLSFIAGPMGIAIDIAISCTFGFLLILALWATGRFSMMAVVMGFGAEMLPGIDAFVPGWSILVHRCIQHYKQTQAQGGAKRPKLSWALDAASLIPGVGEALTAARPVVAAASVATRAASAVQQNSAPRVPLQTRNFDGIRPAGAKSYAQTA